MGHNLRLPLRYVLWAIARLWQDMVRTNDFRTSVTDLKWQGAKVGTMSIINARTEQHHPYQRHSATHDWSRRPKRLDRFPIPIARQPAHRS